MKTPEDILKTNFYKPDLRDWYNPVIHSMKEYASQFFTEEQVREAIKKARATMSHPTSGYYKTAQEIIDQLKEQSKPQSE